MLTRRVALPLAALTAMATMPLLAGAAPAGASGAVMKPAPSSRGNDNGDPEGPDNNKQQKKQTEEQKNCPTEMWTIPLEVKGLACLLLLPKPEKQGDQGEGGGGVGGLLG
jgi:hypothetical protein